MCQGLDLCAAVEVGSESEEGRVEVSWDVTSRGRAVISQRFTMGVCYCLQLVRA